MPDTFSATRYHSLIVDAYISPSPRSELKVVATTEDDGVDLPVVMALMHNLCPIYGVQFHPESICTIQGHKIICNFVNMQGHLPNIFIQEPIENSSCAPDLQALARPVFVRRVENIEADDVSLIADSLYYSSERTKFFWLDSAGRHEMKRTSMTSRFSILGFYDKRLHKPPGLSSLDFLDSLDMSFDAVVDEVLQYECEFLGGYLLILPYELYCETLNMDLDDVEKSDFALKHLFVASVTEWITYDAVSKHLYCCSLLDEKVSLYSTVISVLATKRPTQDFVKLQSNVGSIFPILSCIDTEESYCAKVDKCKEFIMAGQSYELCLTTRFYSPRVSIDPFQYYLENRRRHAAPFSSFINGEDFVICCFSPELFLSLGGIDQLSGNAELIMSPIKGTSKRDLVDPAKDSLLFDSLRNSEKEMAENLMITDLVRNDLARISPKLQVIVRELFGCYKFASCHHMISTVSASSSPTLNVPKHTNALKSLNISLSELFKATFPPGTTVIFFDYLCTFDRINDWCAQEKICAAIM